MWGGYPKKSPNLAGYQIGFKDEELVDMKYCKTHPHLIPALLYIYMFSYLT
jgi:hypothetical protein